MHLVEVPYLSTCRPASSCSLTAQLAIDLRGGVSGAAATLVLRVLVDTERVVLSADPAGRLSAVLPPGGAINVRLTVTNNGNVASG